MALRDIPLERISEADLRRLIEGGAAESRVIDYKRETYGGRPADHVEFLNDVSSFANTLGGDIVIGMSEKKGVPTGFTPYEGDADAELRRLEIWARSGLEPRLPDLVVRAIPIESGGHVLVLRTRRSFVAPHRVNAHDRRRFWVRATTGKYEPDVEQLRRLFNEGSQFAERVRDFRTERLVRLQAGEAPIPMGDGGKVVFHVIPMPAFADGRFVDVVDAVVRGTHVPLPPNGFGRGNRGMANLDGYLNYIAEPHLKLKAYAQLFRNGAIEGVLDLGVDNDGPRPIDGTAFANTVVGTVKQYLGVLAAMEAGAPLYVMLSLVGVAGTMLHYGNLGGGAFYPAGPLERDVVLLPEIALDSAADDVPAGLRPALNMLWNGFGVPQCDMYGSDGHWRGTA